MKFFFRIFFHFALLFLIMSCARRSSPTGGLKDSIPPELLRAYKRFQRESTPTPITQRQADAAAIENIVKEELYGKKYKDKDQVFNIETGLPMSSSALLELYYDSGENLSVLLEKVAASDD